MKAIASLLCSLVWLVALDVPGAESQKTNPFLAGLKTVPAAELPAKAADIVSAARPRDRAATTTGVVQAAVGINPAAAPLIVGAIARAVPAMAAVAAGAAAAEQPSQANTIAKAAAAAAPTQAGRIVEAVCRASPGQYRNVAMAVSQAVPASNKEILEGVAAARPELQPGIQTAILSYNGRVPSVSGTLATTTPSPPANPSTPPPATTTPAVPPPRPPAVGLPYLPPSVTPTNVNPGTGGEVPPGGRNYAEP